MAELLLDAYVNVVGLDPVRIEILMAATSPRAAENISHGVRMNK